MLINNDVQSTAAAALMITALGVPITNHYTDFIVPDTLYTGSIEISAKNDGISVFSTDEEERFKVLTDFARSILEDSKEIDPSFLTIINENFEDIKATYPL